MTGSKQLIEETKMGGAPEGHDPFEGRGTAKIVDRENEYQKGRHRIRELSAERSDPFARLNGDKNQA